MYDSVPEPSAFLKADWLNLLFTDQSVAAMSPEASGPTYVHSSWQGPLNTVYEGGNTTNPSALLVWIGDDPKAEASAVRDWALPGLCKSFLSFVGHRCTVWQRRLCVLGLD